MSSFIRKFVDKRPDVQSGGWSFEADAANEALGFLSLLIDPSSFDDSGITIPSDNVVVKTYSTIAAVQTAITAGDLVNGSNWRIAWASDTYHGTGEVIGRVVQSRPSWRGIIPWPQVGTTVSAVSTVGAATLGADGAGRPLLTVPAVDGDLVDILLGFKGGPPRRYRVVTQFQSNAVTDSGSGMASATIRRDGDPTKYIQLFNQYTGGSWLAGYYYQSSGSFGTDLLDTSAGDASKYTTAKEAIFDLRFALTSAQPTGTYIYSSTGDGTAQTSTPTVSGEGDFTVATQIWEPMTRLRSTGASGSLLITGIEYETRV
jgi:hypothetical protein